MSTAPLGARGSAIQMPNHHGALGWGQQEEGDRFGGVISAKRCQWHDSRWFE